jgi:hypothetical protein
MLSLWTFPGDDDDGDCLLLTMLLTVSHVADVAISRPDADVMLGDFMAELITRSRNGSDRGAPTNPTAYGKGPNGVVVEIANTSQALVSVEDGWRAHHKRLGRRIVTVERLPSQPLGFHFVSNVLGMGALVTNVGRGGGACVLAALACLCRAARVIW